MSFAVRCLLVYPLRALVLVMLIPAALMSLLMLFVTTWAWSTDDRKTFWQHFRDLYSRPIVPSLSLTEVSPEGHRDSETQYEAGDRRNAPTIRTFGLA